MIKISESDEGIMPLDGNPPKSYHNLEKEDYSYKGSVNGRIYTLKYFDTTADGKIYIEGFAKNHNINDKKNMWQDVVIEIFEFSTGKCVGSFDIDDRNDLTRQEDYSLFYYNFCIYNLDPNKLYYLSFMNKVAPSGLDISGYISHDWTLYYTDAFDKIYS